MTAAVELLTFDNTFCLKDQEINVAEVDRNLRPSSLYEHAIRFERDASIADNGALAAYSGVKTGCSPKDRRVVEHPGADRTEHDATAHKLAGLFRDTFMTYASGVSADAKAARAMVT